MKGVDTSTAIYTSFTWRLFLCHPIRYDVTWWIYNFHFIMTKVVICNMTLDGIKTELGHAFIKISLKDVTGCTLEIYLIYFKALNFNSSLIGCNWCLCRTCFWKMNHMVVYFLCLPVCTEAWLKLRLMENLISTKFCSFV
jgi:hypothetical protein